MQKHWIFDIIRNSSGNEMLKSNKKKKTAMRRHIKFFGDPTNTEI